MDIIKTLSKVKLFHELKPESLIDLAQFCSVKHLQTGHQLYDLDDLLLHVYIIAHGRVKLTTRTNLSTYLGRHEIIGEMGVISNQPHHGRVIATRDTCLIEIPQQQFTAFLQKHPQVLFTVSQMIIARSQPELQHIHAMSHSRTLSIIPISMQIPAIHLAEQLTEHLKRWPNVRVVTAAHVDALFGEGFSQTKLDYSSEDLKLRQWLAILEEKHCYVLDLLQKSFFNQLHVVNCSN